MAERWEEMEIIQCYESGPFNSSIFNWRASSKAIRIDDELDWMELNWMEPIEAKEWWLLDKITLELLTSSTTN